MDFVRLLSNFTENELESIIDCAKERALSTGAIMRSKDDPDSSEQVIYAPFSLLPLQLSCTMYSEAIALQRSFNYLMHKVSVDHDFLQDSLRETIEADDFMKKQWDVYVKSRESKFKQDISLLISRSDYMVDTKNNSPCLKQIEFNTIASSFAGLMERITGVQKYTYELGFGHEGSSNMPDSRGACGMAEGLLQSWEIYGNTRAVVLFVVEIGCMNIFDQRCIEWRMQERNKRVRVIRRTFMDLQKNCVVDDDGRLFVDGKEVAVVYYRTGYTPDMYDSDEDWNIRTKIECSTAIKCPSIQLQLTGCKKIQQVLATPGVMERFILDPDVCCKLRNTFAGLYSLDLSNEGDKNCEMALKSDQFVMKPQREGGGHNIYGKDVCTKLAALGRSPERCQYILMERLYPQVQNNIILVSGHRSALIPTISELGIYGVLIGSPDTIYTNYDCGYLVRTKRVGVDEGGVAAGYSGLSALCLT